MPPDLAPYRALITSLIEGRISASEFATVYVPLFKQDQLFRPQPIHELLNDLFGVAEGFTEDARRDNPHEFNENEVKAAAAEAATKLKRLVEEAGESCRLVVEIPDPSTR